MEDETKTELTGILENLDKKIAELQKTVVSPKIKAQIKNLLDKVENREKLPDFSVTLELEAMETEKGVMTLTLSDFLKAINTDATDEDKQSLKNLQIRAEGLRATLDMVESEEIAAEEANKVK